MKRMIIAARMVSSLFRPTYYPLVGIVLLLAFTYLSILPWVYKLWVLGLVYAFTIALPAFGTFLYRSLLGLKALHLRHQHRRMVPYVIHILCYLACLYLMGYMHLPRFMSGILVVSLVVQCLCTLVNIWWKVSMHSAGSGGMIGALLAYSAIFGFNPVWWLCGAILLSGMVMTSRMILRQHDLWQVLASTLLGVACGYFGIILM